MKKKRENMVGVLMIHVSECLHPINILRVQTVVFLEEDCTKRNSISHLLEGN